MKSFFADAAGTHFLDIETLEKASRDFFRTSGTPKLLGQHFFSKVAACRGNQFFEKFINLCGYENNPTGFFKAVFSKIYETNHPIVINDIPIPLLYLYDLIEKILPGNHLHHINSIEALEEKAGVSVKNRTRLQRVMDLFPVRLSDHVIRQSLVSENVAKQYLPFVEELDKTGHVITFDGHFKKGVLEQMYQNRVIFLLDMQCPVYCRFCFRKHKSTRNEACPSPEDIRAAAAYVAQHTAIKEILITGGEPLFYKTGLTAAINSLMKIDHVETIRIATRSVANYPDLFLREKSAYIRYLVNKNEECLNRGKRIELGIHVVHPDEVSIQSLKIMSQFIKKGIQVYVQTPFLKGLNTDPEVLGRLFTLLRQTGVKIYYIFTPCSPIHGTKTYWTTISQSIDAVKYLREHVSDRCIPKLCTATPLGKIEWHSSGWAVEQDKNDSRYIWIRTPYTLSYFKQFIKQNENMPAFRVNAEGTLDAKFLAETGDTHLIKGSRSTSERHGSIKRQTCSKKKIAAVRQYMTDHISLRRSLVPTGSKLISRVHKTCVQFNATSGEGVVDYIKQHPDITDSIICLDTDMESAIEQLEPVIETLKQVPHIGCIRLCCKNFNDEPHLFSEHVIKKISSWCDFSIKTPLKIEIETWFLSADEVLDIHGMTARALIQNGINIYANVPLVDDINDTPKAVLTIAHKLRHSHIEFHHLYAAGLDIQKKYNHKRSPDVQTIIDIASQVRKHCSGREIPLYIVQTDRGERDFGLDDFQP